MNEDVVDFIKDLNQNVLKDLFFFHGKIVLFVYNFYFIIEDEVEDRKNIILKNVLIHLVKNKLFEEKLKDIGIELITEVSI